jgi:hypothetical protein
MPPYLALPHYHLSKLPATTKVALTGFALTVAIGILFAAFGVFAERTDWDNRNVKAHFAGDERASRETGHAYETMHQEPTRRAIYDIVHPHSFLMPVLYFILTHMMEMCFAPRWLKFGLYGGAFLAMILVIFAPYLVWKSLAWAPVVAPAVGALVVSFLIMTAVPVWQMWTGQGRRAPEPSPKPPVVS